MLLNQFSEIVFAISKASDGNMKFSQGDLKETLENRIKFLENLGISFADCLPISIYDPDNKAIGLVHAGWKGLEKGVISKAVVKMQEEFITNPKDLIVQIGPSIGPCHYKKDLWKQAKDQLINLGVLQENIQNLKICTYENEEYFSHRESEDKGLPNDYRFATVLEIKK